VSVTALAGLLLLPLTACGTQGPGGGGSASPSTRPADPPTGCGQQTFYAPSEDLTPKVEWRSFQRKEADRITSVQPPRNLDPPAGKAMKIVVEPGDSPVESGWRAEAIGPVESSESGLRHYRWSTLLDDLYQDSEVGKPNWQVVAQWHQEGDTLAAGGSPPLAVIIEDGKFKLNLSRPDPAHPDRTVDLGPRHVIADATEDVWHTFDLQVRWAANDAGSVQVFHNGALTPTPGTESVPTLYPLRSDPAKPGTVYMKLGLYRAKNTAVTDKSVVYHDEMRAWQC